jgi:hypothetical protein
MIRYISIKEQSTQTIPIKKIDIELSPVPQLTVNNLEPVERDGARMGKLIRTFDFNVPLTMTYTVIKDSSESIEKQKRRFERTAFQIAALGNLKKIKPFKNIAPDQYSAIFAQRK